MLDLVADVESYPEFLPWCSGARIVETRHEGQTEILDADLVISFKPFRESFRSRVVVDRVARSVETTSTRGPFRKLDSGWEFRPADSGCEIRFFVDFEFRSTILRRAIGFVFNQAMQKVVRAFEDRAGELFERGGARPAASEKSPAPG